MDTGTRQLQDLPVMSPQQVIDHFSRKKDKGESPGKVLVEANEFIAMTEAVGGFKLSARVLRSYCSPRIRLMEPPIIKDKKACFVFPDQFDRLGIILTLRQAYSLPLGAIRDLLEHFPKEHHDLIMERKLELDELLDVAKMLKNGYQLKDLIMAKAADVMLQDLMSSSQTVTAALEPGDTLRKLQKKLILGRLDEMKTWVNSGRWQEFLKRESAQDLKDLAVKQALNKRLVRKVLARRARLDRKGQVHS
ncbi:MAG: hypothetical protein HY924_11255 [Elusimicrobia bacterium]|nr:hypothetical protein [Elusimicrobiota bacterium]